MTPYNYIGIALIAFGVYYCLDRKPAKDLPDIPPSIELGHWKVEYYLDQDKLTGWRQIYKSGELMATDQWWSEAGTHKLPIWKFSEEDTR